MQIPIRLYKYIGKQFIISLSIVIATLSLIILLFDAIETLRRTKESFLPIIILIELLLLRLPSVLLEVMPLIILIASLISFVHLTRTSELVVARAAGISAWQFLMPAILISFIFGIFIVIIIGPLSSLMLVRYDTMESKYIQNGTSYLSISSTGIWLKQKNPDDNGKTIIHALYAAQETGTLFEATIYVFDKDNFRKRIYGEKMELKEGYWYIKSAIINNETSMDAPITINDYTLETPFKLKQIQSSFAKAETISFWQLPQFINTLNAAGLPTRQHTLRLHQIIVSPLILSSMVFFAAAFSLRMPRKGKMWLFLSGGILSGFAIHILSQLIFAVGLAGNIPVMLAAWAPMLISVLVGTTLMLHLEDG